MVSVAADSEGSTDPRIHDIFFIVDPNGARLAELAAMLDRGDLRTFVNAVVPLRDAALAYTRSTPGITGHGKFVLDCTAP